MKRNANTPYEAVPYETYRFEKELLGIEGRIRNKVLRDLPSAHLEMYLDEYCKDLVVRLTHKPAYGDKVLKEEFEVPKTWWDHLKHDLNSWAWKWVVDENRFFFTNVAKAIIAFKLTPCFRTIPVYTQTIRNYCPHVSTGDNRSHIEFLLQRSFGEDFHG